MAKLRHTQYNISGGMSRGSSMHCSHHSLSISRTIRVSTHLPYSAIWTSSKPASCSNTTPVLRMLCVVQPSWRPVARLTRALMSSQS
ncbi:hypothetical protein FOZ60_015966 [Perkinsus olseni]|uniref:Uncharacterized protein n=1 Tax=Perkinsus olseni TaxID=32597 RepID=A0A7J6N4X9_PEROL|nr:hypothetical protein FOZ60_015966 [Perkinsus olseni]